ncbi:MAG: hypothetical protein QF613_06650 [Candidatus Marinimicrobia bacterium]|jgi:GNAT superfamily N-acetyltransferase|nr:hypothetical protein [Candidatus Neomarinimicrobiota bacterium]MDP6456794.1 hypothetical protein [Candidatus Neomarinimicrobiota bacterium]MDP6593867.1 hypothetical protein [Candidatus Neomarinimicrobiota bacterium]MDP6835896.1 hypothetical protein [Candidatus Neomarinimicrobiota bacterium]MDP6966730.1 hypothetical protein [Candidatus Neomarinimicrobiota bacterium]|tara:strand:+ start:125 stop:727 length:603 start_codon:yes stop_codon:yes gene_type:complete
MEHTYRLKDGSQVIVRDLTVDDVEASYEFFKSFSEDRRRYFRSDVTVLDYIRKRILKTEDGQIIRRVAILDGEFVGDGSLEIATKSWKSGEAQLRLVILPEYEGKGIQFVFAKDMYDMAHERHLNKIIVKFMRPQEDLMRIYSELGFHMEGVLPDYLVDQAGHEQDMVVMIATLEDMRKAYKFVGDWLDDEHGTIRAGEM